MHYATTTLSRNAACLREGHFKAALRVYGYLKAYAKERIDVDPEIPLHHSNSLKYDSTEFYPGATEELPYDMLLLVDL